MSARRWLAIALTVLSSVSFAQEACDQDDTGLTSQLQENIVLESARTAEDFLNAALHRFFTDPAGIVDYTLLINDLGPGEWMTYFLSLGSVFEHSFVLCNDIGQCAQGQLEMYFSKTPSAAATDAANSVFDSLTGGELSVRSVYATRFIEQRWTVTTGDGDSADANIPDLTSSQVRELLDYYPVRANDDPLVTDKRCRNNFGELAEGQPEMASSGGGSQPLPELGSHGYWRKVHTGWHCYADETGVVCRKTYDYVWVDW